MNFIFLMDPLETVNIHKDTSFIFMIGARRKGHKTYFVADGNIHREAGKLIFDTLEVIPQKKVSQPFRIVRSKRLTENDIDAVFVRNDPPFDAQYLLNTWFLDLLPKRILVINDPSGIRSVNEKLWATQFTSITPPTLISRQKDEFLRFLKKYPDVIAKPLNGFGGQSVFRIQKGDLNRNVILETLTQRWSQEIILQKYISQAKNGDKRILLLYGEPLGAVLRLHSKEDHRNNFFAGGKPMPAVITERDRQIIKALKPKLRELGLYFVGIDVIGDYLIEVNVTSPTCLQEMNKIYKRQLENHVIKFVETVVDQLQSESKIAKKKELLA